MKLEYKVTLLIFAVLLAVGVPGGALMLHLQREGLKSEFEATALTVAETLYDSLVSDMQSVRQDHIQDTVTRASAGAVINEVVIFSPTQKVYASGELSEIGQTRNDEYIALALETGATVTRTEEQYGRTEVCVVLPVFNSPQCYECHDDEKMILGAIEVGLDRSGLDANMREQTMMMGLTAGLTFVVVGGALAFVFRSEVAGPLSRLGGTARRIAKGDFAARAEAGARGEVGLLARTFNEMAEHVQEYAGALEESKRDLEQKVQDRTAQLLEMATIRGQLLDRLISAQEEERRRIARELHDEAGQALTMMMMDLARAADALPEGATEARDKLTHSRSLAAQTLAELRKMIYDLRPEVLDQLGLVPAMRSYVRSRLEAENVKTRLSFVGLDHERLSPEVEITLFRVVQEAVTNIIRHSGASSVDIEVVRKGSIVTAIVADDGKGFDTEAALRAPESWGLRGIRERIAVVGDLILDVYLWGRSSRISEEAPVPIVKINKRTHSLGGAANVMRNLVTMGGEVKAFGAVGADEYAEEIHSLLGEYHIDSKSVYTDSNRRTTEKQRLIAGSQQLARIDYEDIEPLRDELRKQLVEDLSQQIKKQEIDAVIFEDYAKGVLDGESITAINKVASEAGIIVGLDPHSGHFMNISGLTVITPNRSETFTLSGFYCSDPVHPVEEDRALIEAATKFQDLWKPQQLLVTLGAQGMMLFGEDGNHAAIPTQAREVYDVSGAGDTVISAYVLSLLGGAAPEESAVIANHAAGIVVGKAGTVSVAIDELLQSFPDGE